VLCAGVERQTSKAELDGQRHHKQVIVRPVNIDFPPEYDVTLTRSSTASISSRIMVRSLSGAGGASSNVSLRSRSDANPRGQRLKPVNAELQVGRDAGTCPWPCVEPFARETGIEFGLVGTETSTRRRTVP
jgi:hypothetical protein